MPPTLFGTKPSSSMSASILGVVLVAVMLLFVALLVQQSARNSSDPRHPHDAAVAVIAAAHVPRCFWTSPRYVNKIIQDIGKQEASSGAVLSKDGVIAHSNYPSEIGKPIDKQAEQCSLCHEGRKALTELPNHKKWRLFEGPRPAAAAGQHGSHPQRGRVRLRRLPHKPPAEQSCWAWSTSPTRSTKSTARCGRSRQHDRGLDRLHRPRHRQRRLAAARG
jgi:hypothetical protein